MKHSRLIKHVIVVICIMCITCILPGDSVPMDQQMELKATDALASSASTQNLTTLLTHAPTAPSSGESESICLFTL